MLHYHDHGCLVALFVPNEHNSEKNACMMYAFLACRVSTPPAVASADAYAIAPPATTTASTALSPFLLWLIKAMCYFSGHSILSLHVTDLFSIVFFILCRVPWTCHIHKADRQSWPFRWLDIVTSLTWHVLNSLSIYLFLHNKNSSLFNHICSAYLVVFCLGSSRHSYSAQGFPAWPWLLGKHRPKGSGVNCTSRD